MNFLPLWPNGILILSALCLIGIAIKWLYNHLT